MDTPSTPGLRLIELLERLAALEGPFTLSEAVAAGGLPKPTTHRMLQQLEAGGLLGREPSGRRYQLAPRLVGLAENVLRASTRSGLRHAVLAQLVAELGETCNLTALAGADVIYLDRVETAFPLRLDLHPGLRVPLHCSASGKLFLAYMPAARRRELLAQLPLTRQTAHTLTTPEALERELAAIRRQGYSVDAEEFIEGLVCVAVPVRASAQGEVRCALALQAPQARLPLPQALQQLGRLQAAAQAMSRSLG